MKTLLPAIALGISVLAAPSAFADAARDNLIRAEANVGALNSADAFAAAPENFETARLRLREAQVAEDRNRDEESRWRSAEADLHAEIVQEKIKLRALERTVSEIEAGIAVLRRELTS